VYQPAKMIAKDGEGATRLIEVNVTGAVEYGRMQEKQQKDKSLPPC